MATAFGRPFYLRSSSFITFLILLSWSNLVLAGEIHEAVKNNDLVKVKSLIKDSSDLVFSKDEDGFTPLHLAAANGYKDIAELLLASKADIEAKDKSRSTPLHQGQGRRQYSLDHRGREGLQGCGGSAVGKRCRCQCSR